MRARRFSAIFKIVVAKTLRGYDATAGGNFGVGRLTAAQNEDADIALTYDARGNVVADTRTLRDAAGSHNYSTQYAWDAAGRLAAITYPTGRVVTYARSAAGEITDIITQVGGGPVETVVSGLAWEPFGPVSRLTDLPVE